MSDHGSSSSPSQESAKLAPNQKISSTLKKTWQIKNKEMMGTLSWVGEDRERTTSNDMIQIDTYAVTLKGELKAPFVVSD